MKAIDRETVQRIIDTADIVEVVSDFVHLRRRGANYVGLCPFHNERTPSFSVSRAKGICKCFSCGKGGSAVNFIMEHEQLSYWDALRYLARKYNIEIQEHEVTDAERQAMSERQALFDVNDFALKHFEENMQTTPDGRDIGLAYFRERGINDAMVRKFHLGYSLDRRDDLLAAARRAGYSDEALVRTGLCIRTDRGELYDRFKARVMYPVFTISGKVVAFGGRTLRSDKTVAKYVNSPESLIYKKNRELYGLYQAKQAIVRKDKCILVEGYMDVISMHQQGVENVVASSGTSLTQGQIRLLHRFTDNVTVIYDSDAAGIKASLRGIDLLLAEGLNIKVLLLPDGDDPDSFAQSHSASEVEAYLDEHEVDFIHFKTDVLLRDASGDPLRRSKVVGSILQSIANIPEEIKRNMYIQECSIRFGIEEPVLLRQVNLFITQLAEQAARNAARQHAADSIDEGPGVAAGQSPAAPAAPAASPQAPAQGQGSVPSGAGDASTGASQAPVPPSAPQPQGPQPAAAAAEAPAADDQLAISADMQAAVRQTADPYAQVLEPQERALLRLALKFGMVDLGEQFGVYEDGSHVKVLDYIREDLEVDSITFHNQLYSRIFREALDMRDHDWDADFAAHLAKARERFDELLRSGLEEIRQTAENMEDIKIAEQKLQVSADEAYAADILDFSQNYLERRFLSHPDDEMRRATSDLLVEKYQLSKIYFRQGTRIETEIDRLDDLIPRALVALKYDIGRCRFRELTARIAALQATPGYSLEEVLSLMTRQKKWQEFCHKLASEIGERVYEPLR